MTDLIPTGAECRSKKHDALARNRGVRIPQGRPNSGSAPEHFLYELELLEDAKVVTWEPHPTDAGRQAQTLLKKGAITTVTSTLVERT